ncbi:bifunctional nicotinamidase/pyrazinamidase [Neochlamydia sp. S13]|uniref:bifunctional nicotinamidase/pyrazinamidase n=1 Tax=Neochlamydia sp. S13 TaxID=1353976 RepID=UPI0005A9547D|nr:bifunctional nicotinamidase/pyrazinamidase [Neochlamydia sp. S13]BBI16448.1 Pyrazinamidase/nicotinamidase [Neochlamydia sp. S13]
MTALLIIDVQNDFFPPGALAIKDAEKILPNLNKIIRHPFEVIVATKDWHPLGHVSFASSHGKEVGEVIHLGGLEQVLWPIHCVQDSVGAQFSAGWDSHRVQKVIYKGTDKRMDSYSAFFDNGRSKATELHNFLQSKGIKKIFLGGLATEYCVKYSALDALNLNYQVYVIIDACKPVNSLPAAEEKHLNEILQAGGSLIEAKEVIKSLTLSYQK